MTYSNQLTSLVVALLISAGATAQPAATGSQQQPDSLLRESAAMTPPASSRAYTKESPLIYEGSWDLWPYTFLNDNGEPDGYSVDLVRLILNRLKIPYEIRLKPTDNVFNDLKNGQSDLMLGVAAGFHDEFGSYGTTALTLFTQSVVTPKGKPVQIRSFRDLANNKVIVNDGSLCYHLMLDYGWGDNAIPSKDLKESILDVSAREEGQIVWNTLSLKWLIKRYQLDNLEITPVNMPHGEYKFMSNDKQLLARLDSMYAVLNSAELIAPIQNKWFYPDRHEKTIPRWVWYAIGAAGLLTLLLSIYIISYRVQGRRITRDNNRRNRRLALILETSQVHVWTYDIANKQFTWRNENGQPAYTYTSDEFSQRYSPEDFMLLRNHIHELSESPRPKDGEEKEIKLNIKAKDTEGGGDDIRDFTIVLSVLSRDNSGKPTVIIGTKKDITERVEQERLDNERNLRYWAIFNTPMVGIMLFDREGLLQNINQRACEMYHCDHDEILAERVSLFDMLDIDGVSLDQLDDMHATQIVDIDKIPQEQRTVLSCKRKGKLFNEFRLMTVYDENQELLGVFAVCSDVTYIAHSIERERASIDNMNKAKASMERYTKAINELLAGADMRMVSYSPQLHMLTFYDRLDHVQLELTQTRCMTLIDHRMQTKAMRLMSEMDDGVDHDFSFDIRTLLRGHGSHIILHLQFELVPVHDHQGKLTEYFGICKDVSELKLTEQLLAVEKAKTQEIEDTKTGFMRNMMEEIRIPLDNVVESVATIDAEHLASEEMGAYNTILTNAERLTHIIDSILTLSRIEAHMVEIQKSPTDFAEVFSSHCENGWGGNRQEGVRYIVENPYDKLVVDIDNEHLGGVIQQVAKNAAQHTFSGAIRARYDYIGRRLWISVEDSGEGMTPAQLAELHHQLSGGNQTTSSGLGLTICNEMVKQMGGTLEVNSEQGLGTYVMITIPCNASAIKRKLIA